MFTVTNKQILGADAKRLDISAAQIAQSVKPGQFVVIVSEENDAWVPLTVIEADTRRGTIAVVFKETEAATKKLGAKAINETIFSVIGPLGNAVDTEKVGVVVCAATEEGIVRILPICRALKKNGNKVVGVISASTRKSLVLETQMRLSCDKLLIATEDGSCERRGTASALVQELLDKEKANLVYAIGAVNMMQAVSQMTRKLGVKTLVQLAPIMLCGIGICGSCRIKVGKKMILCCELGPEFDGHKVDYDNLRVRMNAFTNLNDKNCVDSTGQKQDESGFLNKLVPGSLKKI